MSSDIPSFDTSSINPSWKIGIVRSIWHGELTQRMMNDAEKILKEAGIKTIHLVDAPGTFEIPLLAQNLIATKEVDGVIALAVILEGETSHAEMIVQSTVQALMDLQLKTGVPVINELVHTNETCIAKQRSETVGSIGAKTLLHVLNQHAKIKE
jgi:6,7-dimethyl-8-ribityllumazine synthase